MVSTMEVTWGRGVKVSRNKGSAGEYLAFLSMKYEVDPDKLFHALISAEKNQKSRCENLSIECRSKTLGKAVFLIMKEFKVIAQFPIFTDFLSSQSNPIKDFMKTDRIQRHVAKKNNGLRSLLIRDLRSGMKQVNLRAKVLEIPRSKLVFTRYGNYASVANALIADETGTIKLCLWNEQIESVVTGDTIQVENARISTFRGERQLSMGKKGTLTSVKDVASSTNSRAELVELAHSDGVDAGK
jgi:replication factor A1